MSVLIILEKQDKVLNLQNLPIDLGQFCYYLDKKWVSPRH